MNTTDRQRSLANARRACEWLRKYSAQMQPLQSDLMCLVAEFTRMDTDERKRNAAVCTELESINELLHRRQWSTMSQTDLVLLLGDIAQLAQNGSGNERKGKK